MNILMVSPWMPHAGARHAGSAYLFETVRWLARKHTVHLLCYQRSESPDEVDSIVALCRSLTTVRPAYAVGDKLSRFLHGGWRRPARLGRQTHDSMRRHIGLVCARHRIDVVHCWWTETARYLDAVPPRVARVVGTMDVEYRVRPREVALYPPGCRRWQAGRRARWLIRCERELLPAADAVLTCSQADRRDLAAVVDAARLQVVTPWIDAERMAVVAASSAAPGRLTFMGAMDRRANIAAAAFLVDRVWPRLRDALPRARLYIVGAGPPADVYNWASRDDRIVVTGLVDDMAAVWASTDIALSPSLIGGGLVTKVAQPMAAGRPVVTTTLGNEGVAAPAGAVCVADDPAAFAGAVLKLAANPDAKCRLAENGRDHALSALDWTSSMGRLERAYAAAVRRAREQE